MEWAAAFLTSPLVSTSSIRSVVEGVSKGVATLQHARQSQLTQQLCRLFSDHLSLVGGAAEVLLDQGTASLQQAAAGWDDPSAVCRWVEGAPDPVALFSALLSITISCENSELSHKMAANLAQVLFPSGTSQSFRTSCVVNCSLAGLSPDMVNYYGLLLLQRISDVHQAVLLGLQIIGSHHSTHTDPAVEVKGGSGGKGGQWR